MHAGPLDGAIHGAGLGLPLALDDGQVLVLAVPKLHLDLPLLIDAPKLLNQIGRLRLVRPPPHQRPLPDAQLRARPGVGDPVAHARVAALLPRFDVVSPDPCRVGREVEGRVLLAQVDDVHLPQHGERARDANRAGKGRRAPVVGRVGLGLALAVSGAGGGRVTEGRFDGVAAALAVEVAAAAAAGRGWASSRRIDGGGVG